jgi:(S)-ureidoglycine aminohydrolase
MPQKGLVTSRVVVARDHAILPPEGIPESTLPEWRETGVRILAAPAMGARFAQYLLDVRAGGGSEQALRAGIETFFYVLEGGVTLEAGGRRHALGSGGYAYLKPGSRFALSAKAPARVLWLKKVYQPFGSKGPEDVVGEEASVKGEPFMEVAELLLKTLLPVDPAYDMAMNIFTFPPGFSLPITETHVMEHGLYMLEGQGLYYLGDRWREVQAGDFIWMGPYCPQSFYATSSIAARYIYYKNVNRDVEL